MSSKGLSNRIKLSSYDDMFSAENDGNATSEAKTVEGQIVEIPLSELHTFENHPFRVVDDENMEEMVESVKEYGVLVPAIARPRAEGGYELISGHRRKHASELAGKDTLNAAVSDGLLTVQAVDKESGIKVIYVNGYEFTDGITNGTLNIRLSQFDAGYEYFTITAMDQAGNVSEVYKTKNPYYKDPNSDDDSNPAEQLPASAQATNPSSATANVTQHTQTDSNGNTTSQTPKTPEEQKREEFARADAEEEAMKDAESEGEDMNLGKEFYTIQAASGKVFYLIIDRDGEEEVVYFLTEITENDLLNVTSDNSETLPKNSAALESQIPVTESALPNNNTEIDDTHEVETPVEETTDESVEETEEEPEAETEEPVKSNPLVGYLIMGIFGAGVIGAAYYFKVVKKKQDGDFVEDEDEEDDDEEYESESEESETDGDDDFFNDQEAESERPAPTAEDVADTIEDEDGDPYESDSDEE